MMLSIFKRISERKKSILLICIVLIIAISFETLQQLYYIKRFNISQGVVFFGLLKTQTKSWLIWVLLSFPLVKFIKGNTATKNSLNTLLKSTIVVLGLTALSIIIISTWQFLASTNSFSLNVLFSEYVQFYVFQKAPVFTLGYIAIAIILHLYFLNEQLLVKVEELGKIKQRHTNLYNQLSEEIDDKASILNIKIGNKRKIIAVEHIYWIEADDYCVKIHTKNETHVMRASLKALDKKLGYHFLRVHRKAIVNMNKVIELNLNKTPELILENMIAVTISKSNLKMVRNFIS